MVRAETVAAAALTTIIVALGLVGLVSGTILRHAVQVTPILVASLVVMLRPGLGRYAAFAIFSFWFFIMVLIWLYLLGLARVVTGQFSAAEIALTMVVGFACLVGFPAAARMTSRIAWWAGLAGFAMFGALQVGAMWLSLQPAFATR